MPRLLGCVVVVLAVMAAAPARADPANECKELHCYCDGPGEPDTVAACDTTCEEVCAASVTGASRVLRPAAWSLTAVAGASYASSSGGPASVPDGGAFGLALQGRVGRTSAGIIVRLALVSTPIEGAGLARERAFVFEFFDVGLEISPRAAIGDRWEVRPTAAIWLSSLALVGCGGCEAARGDSSAGGLGWAARAGVDVYLGRYKKRGLGVAVVYSRQKIGDVASGDATEHAAPTVMVQLGLTSLWNR